MITTQDLLAQQWSILFSIARENRIKWSGNTTSYNFFDLSTINISDKKLFVTILYFLKVFLLAE